MNKEKLIGINFNNIMDFNLKLGYIIKNVKNSYLLDFNDNEYKFYLDSEIFSSKKLNVGQKLILVENKLNPKEFILIEYSLFKLCHLIFKLNTKLKSDMKYNYLNLIYISYLLQKYDLINVNEVSLNTKQLNFIKNINQPILNKMVYLHTDLLNFNKINFGLLINLLSPNKLKTNKSKISNGITKILDLKEIKKWKN